MNDGKLQNIMAESNNLNGSQRRRSARLSSPPQANVKTDNKMARPSVAVKRSITVRKIAPRKTVAPSAHNKENTPKRAVSEGNQKNKLKVSTPGHVPGPGGSSSAKKKKAAMPSPILPSSPPPPTNPQQPAADPEDAVWSQKVRRSYSRLSDKSDSRETFFGFEKLKTPEVFRRVEQSKTGLDLSAVSLSGLNSFTSLLEAEERGPAFPEPDLNIPGVAVVKEKRRRKKVQHIDATELDAMAAKMNAEFEEAEVFELVVE
ncbi:sororin [Micropterus salmoides]|uniref:sororin n=1 Tax=Micropterus salmoides TaxID=27706 RepID=UPI0018EDBC32|nr:sororin [Micropterus salmoides]XP_045914167.1 sororin [Micropterus dolomieu]